MSNKNLACYTSLHIQNLLRTQIFINYGLFLWPQVSKSWPQSNKLWPQVTKLWPQVIKLWPQFSKSWPQVSKLWP